MEIKGIEQKAMLVCVNISVWTARRKDKKATETVEREHGVVDVGKFFKDCIDRSPLKKVQTAANDLRTWHYVNTLPWSDEGWRILTYTNYETYMKGFRERESKFEQSYREFENEYPQLKEEARKRLNGLFNEDDYPSDIRAKFGVSKRIKPIPMAGDFRVELHADEVKNIQAEMEKDTTNALQEAHKDLYRRLYEAVKHMSEKLKDKDAVFRNSLVSNLVDLCNLIPRMNIVGDANLDALRQAVEQSLVQLSPDILREDNDAREKTAKDADAILGAIGAIYEG